MANPPMYQPMPIKVGNTQISQTHQLVNIYKYILNAYEQEMNDKEMGLI